MRIQTKLIAYFLGMVLLVPILGGVAMGRVRSIDSTVEDLSSTAIPNLRRAEGLAEIQRQQQIAVLNYLSTGRIEDRQKYLDLAQTFDQELTKLKETDTSERGKEQIQAITAERAKFSGAASQLVSSRDTIDRNLANLNQKHDEMVKELNSIRARFAGGGSAASAPNAGSDLGTIPQSLRNQVNDLLLGTEGMLHQVATEFQIASQFTISPDDKIKAQFDDAGPLFASSFAIANAAGGPEDRVILARVQTRFREFETSARAMITAGDVAKRARVAFPEASDKIAGILTGYVGWQADQVTAARAVSADSVSSAQQMILLIMIGGILLAALLGIYFSRSITKPIRRLRDVADRVSMGNVEDVDIEVKGKDEIAELSDAFRRMVASIRYLMHREPEKKEDTGDDLDFDFDFKVA
jgi:HAMP domain-containing protein